MQLVIFIALIYLSMVASCHLLSLSVIDHPTISQQQNYQHEMVGRLAPAIRRMAQEKNSILYF